MFKTQRQIFSYFFTIKPFSGKKDKGYKILKKIIKEYVESSSRFNKYRINKDLKYSVKLVFYFKSEKRKIDVDNLSKPILDAMSKNIYRDDTQIFKLFIEKKYDQIFEGFSVDVFKL